MIEPQFLTVADVLTIHEEQIEAYGGIRGIRDEGLLALGGNDAASEFWRRISTSRFV
jgi:prophage maintenance system killer protein